MRIRTISVALGLSAVVVLTVLLAGLGQDTARGTGTSLFGDGSDGPITFSTNTQFDPPADAAVDSGSIGSTALTVSGETGAFVPGQKILIHQTRGSTAVTSQPNWEIAEVATYSAGTITTTAALARNYATSGASAAQVLVIPQYTDVTVFGGVTVTAKPWDGAKGGILAFMANGTVTVSGTISASGRGYRGGPESPSDTSPGSSGEGNLGPSVAQTAANGTGGGGSSGSFGNLDAAGGGGHATDGQTGNLGIQNGPGVPGDGGGHAGVPDLTAMIFGGGGGSAAAKTGHTGGAGGTGGGIIVVFGTTIVVNGAIVSNGAAGQDGTPSGANGGAGGGGGAGGSVLLRGADIALGLGYVTATAGVGGNQQGNVVGGTGGFGRIRAEYCTGISGFADPAASIGQTSCDASPKGNTITITNVFQDPLPKTCFDVMDSGQTFLFSVCDNDFQDGFPVSHAACDDGSDTVCNDEDPTEGSVTVSVSQSTYNVELGKTPLNITADATKGVCSSGPTCSLTFTSVSGARPWNPWDVAGPGNSWPPDGVVDLPNDILGVILHFCPNGPCVKP